MLFSGKSQKITYFFNLLQISGFSNGISFLWRFLLNTVSLCSDGAFESTSRVKKKQLYRTIYRQKIFFTWKTFQFLINSNACFQKIYRKPSVSEPWGYWVNDPVMIKNDYGNRRLKQNWNQIETLCRDRQCESDPFYIIVPLFILYQNTFFK